CWATSDGNVGAVRARVLESSSAESVFFHQASFGAVLQPDNPTPAAKISPTAITRTLIASVPSFEVLRSAGAEGLHTGKSRGRGFDILVKPDPLSLALLSSCCRHERESTATKTVAT